LLSNHAERQAPLENGLFEVFKTGSKMLKAVPVELGRYICS
jgi:hypothetical protein